MAPARPSGFSIGVSRGSGVSGSSLLAAAGGGELSAMPAPLTKVNTTAHTQALPPMRDANFASLS
jgi:hypothetical protein